MSNQLMSNNNRFLEANYAPVHDELFVENLSIQGEMPKDLNGIYMRNGPNPQFTPISYTYPFDGDGMIHAVYISEGKASYRNRFIETRELLKERRAGKALYGGVLNPIALEPKWQDPEDGPVAFKNGAFIHVIQHGERYLAMSESVPAYEITSQLKTLGHWKPQGVSNNFDICAHMRLDPKTGELWLINYDLVTQPYLTIYQLAANGVLLKKFGIDKLHPTVIHDFVLTQNYVIIFDCPLIFDMNKITQGGAALCWQPELGVRIGIMPRSGGEMHWITTEPFFNFHFANAFEHDDKIIVDYVRREEFKLLLNNENNPSKFPMLFRTSIHLPTGTVQHTQLDDRCVEFPRIREDYITQQQQYIYLPTKSESANNSSVWNKLIKYDVKNNTSIIHDFGQQAGIDEAVFVPAKNSKSEDDGYVLLFVYNNETSQSEFCILDANNFTAEPLARIKMPRRVPHGLHGSWMHV
jgi:carotenoid cleavage dioxygenase